MHKKINMKRSLVIAAAFAGLFVATGASAQELKIGVVNIQALLQAAPQTKTSMEALQEEFAPRERTVLAKQKELEELSEKAQRDLAVMGDGERRNMERDLREGQRELQRLQEEFVEDRNLRQNEELGKLQRLLLTEVDAFGKANGYDLILSDGVVFGSGRVVITSQILEQIKGNASNGG